MLPQKRRTDLDVPPSPARLKRSYIERRIEEMEVGETGWSVPWAMQITEDGTCFLDPGYPIFVQPGGTVCMRIGRQEDGYVVDIHQVYDKQWHRSANAHGIPVVAVID